MRGRQCYSNNQYIDVDVRRERKKFLLSKIKHFLRGAYVVVWISRILINNKQQTNAVVAPH